MTNELDDFRLQLRKVRELSKHQPPVNFYPGKMSEDAERTASKVVSTLQPWIAAFVQQDKKFSTHSTSANPFAFHLVYHNSTHCRIAIGAVTAHEVYVNAMVGARFNLNHFPIYSGSFDEAMLTSATQDFLVRCYKFLLTGQFTC